MKEQLLFDLTVNKENNTINVKREFDADIDLVWDTWTKPELLDQWWAPRPYRIETRSMDFREGGTWLYAMISPKDETLWCKADYKNIEPLKQLSWLDAFCDENGNDNAEKPRSLWKISFAEDNGITTAIITVQQESLADVELMIQLGLNKGLTMTLGNLDELLLTLNK